MEDTEKQDKKQYDWLAGYRWHKGQSGNPKGRPKGKTLKTFAREYLEALPDEEKVKYLATLPAEIVWKMAEGNPAQDMTSGGEPIVGVQVYLPKKDAGVETISKTGNSPIESGV